MSYAQDRAPRPTRRMGTEVIDDRRTRRRRSRGDDERAAIHEEELEVEADVEEAIWQELFE